MCALQEGVFPARARPQPFLAEEERRRLAETSGLRLGEHEDALAAERYLLYAAISRPEELLVLSWHVADDDGEPTARSLFVDDVCDLFEASLDERSEIGRRARMLRPTGRLDCLGPGASAVCGMRDAARRAAPGRFARARLVGLVARDMDSLPGPLVRRADAAAWRPSTRTPSRSPGVGWPTPR